MTQWEYRWVELIRTRAQELSFSATDVEVRKAANKAVEDEVSALGAAGWEAVGPVTITVLTAGDLPLGYGTRLLFKRQKTESN